MEILRSRRIFLRFADDAMASARMPWTCRSVFTGTATVCAFTAFLRFVVVLRGMAGSLRPLDRDVAKGDHHARFSHVEHSRDLAVRPGPR